MKLFETHAIFSVVTADRLRSFITEVMSRMHAECFIYGNINKEKAIQMSTLVENQLKNTNAFILPQLSRQLLLKREYQLNESNYSFISICTHLNNIILCRRAIHFRIIQ